MEQTWDKESSSMNEQPQEWAKLIRKLRWIGLEDEAFHLQTALSSLRPEDRGTVSSGPFNTD